MMRSFVQGVLAVEDEIYISEPNLRLTNGSTIRVVYSDLRSDAGETEENNPLSLFLDIKLSRTHHSFSAAFSPDCSANTERSTPSR